MTETVDVAIIGAGPAGLAAAIECAKAGCETVVMDSETAPGGQLVKQIHKFFGARAQRAGRRGPDIAAELVRRASDVGADIRTDAIVQAADPSGRLQVLHGSREWAGRPNRMRWEEIAARGVILATGAEEKAAAFPGWTLPGVMGAGAVQTMVNIYMVLPGRRVLMVGAGNVGLIVTYQLLQAGASVHCVVEAAPEVGGYGVHAAKIRRAGVPIRTSHTVLQAVGNEEGVRAATLARVDGDWNPLPGTEETIDVDLICIAAGLRPDVRLSRMVGCRLIHSHPLGGWLPRHNSDLVTTNPTVFVAGDAGGVEEATIAVQEGRLAGLSAARSLGRLDSERAREQRRGIHQRLAALRGGPAGAPVRRAKIQLWREAAGDADRARPNGGGETCGR